MNGKLGIILDYLENNNYVENLKIIKEAGFTTFFTGFYDYGTVKKVKDEADYLGLEYEFIHSPFDNINSMWLEGNEYEKIYNEIIKSIDSASLCNIKTIILHVSSGWFPPEINDLGLKRYDELVEYARKKNVIVAFENLRKIGNLAYFIDRYEEKENVRFCFDSGHAFCYTPSINWIDVFNKKLICTHIHDNHGRDFMHPFDDGDEHLLPFDGIVDYKNMMDRLKAINYSGSLMLEVFKGKKEEYKKMSDIEFTKTCFERIKKISEL